MSARGRCVVLLGPDGCGKSAVVGALRGALAPGLAVDARHYRPQVPWGAGSPVPDPHARPPRGPLGSALKLAFDLARFRIGHRRLVRPRLAAGRVVLFDRYFHDVLADPRRYRYGGPAWLARLAARLAPAPDLFVVLDAPAEVLQARKAEVPPAESAAAREAYRSLARSLPRAHLVDAARPLAEVAAEVAALVRGGTTPTGDMAMQPSWKRFPPPRGALLLPVASAATAAAAVALEAPCRPTALAARRAAGAWIARAGAGALPGRSIAWTPPLPADDWDGVQAGLLEVVGSFHAFAVRERRQPGRRGFTLLFGDARGPAAFVKLRPAPAERLRTERAVLEAAEGGAPRAFGVPRVLGHGRAGGWEWLALSVIPPLHRPPADPRLGAVTVDVMRLLRGLPRPADTPRHWVPMHGDLTPWNLRQSPAGELWLFDWERARWAPPGADHVLYRVTAGALRGGRDATALAACAQWPEAASFWAERVRARVPAGRAERRLRAALLALLGAEPDAEGEPPRRALPALDLAEAT